MCASGRLWARTVGVIAGLVTLARLVLVGALEPREGVDRGRHGHASLSNRSTSCKLASWKPVSRC